MPSLENRTELTLELEFEQLREEVGLLRKEVEFCIRYVRPIALSVAAGVEIHRVDAEYRAWRESECLETFPPPDDEKTVP